MANLTLVVDDDLLKRARIKALEEGTSVNAVVRDHLTRYARSDDAAAALARVVNRARRSSSGSGPDGRTWTRDDAHER